MGFPLRDPKTLMKIKLVKQNELTSDCWSVQIWGLESCDFCPYINTEDCGGKDIRRKLMNDKHWSSHNTNTPSDNSALGGTPM